MIWNIHYTLKGTRGYRAGSTMEIALRLAGELLDQGADVREVASNDGNKTIGADKIKLICAERKATKLG